MQITPVAARFAVDQLGLVTRRQLLTNGVSRSAIHKAVGSGRLVRLEVGVYALPGVPLTADTRLLAKVLAAGDGAMVSHRSAAKLWDLVDDAPPNPEVSVPRGRNPRKAGIVVRSSTDLDLVIPGRVRGIPVTDVGRTILDCAGVPGVDIELLIDEARRRHDISRTLLPWIVATHARSGRRGIDRLRRHLEIDELPDSDFERLVCRWLDAEGVGGWTLHHRIVVPGFGPIEFDLAWPTCRLALELEGADHRDRSGVHDRDTRRQNVAHLAGWDVLRVTYRRWIRSTAAVLAEITAAIAVPVT
ncbi:type IV toxin-antitoxin system AbiEi family antitoxin domain-containing protein [Actinospongicola halichondriae]|uniref:type IV toxin-antitoxin system AbiEi family antitoxin domain-containing protein n=1 Tax=Actinospongicola halichondriae TaxID=3236844 RepID=UPI003D3E807B